MDDSKNHGTVTAADDGWIDLQVNNLPYQTLNVSYLVCGIHGQVSGSQICTIGEATYCAICLNEFLAKNGLRQL